MDIKIVNQHFKYYFENETQFLSSERYAYISKSCQKVYSFVYANLLLTICSDFESLLRFYFSKKGNEVLDIDSLISLIKNDQKLSKILNETVIFENCDYGVLTPFKINHNNKTNKDSFYWWGAYNEIKHNKVQKIKSAKQIVILNALAALYALNRYILSIATEETKQMDVFSEDRNLFKLINLKTRTISSNSIFFERVNTID